MEAPPTSLIARMANDIETMDDPRADNARHFLTDILIIAQQAVDEKSNEITAIPEVLKMLDIRGAAVTLDAMGTQTEIAAQIVKGGGD